MINVLTEQFDVSVAFSVFFHITNSLEWLDENESKWHLEKSIDRHEFIENLLMKATITKSTLQSSATQGLNNV